MFIKIKLGLAFIALVAGAAGVPSVAFAQAVAQAGVDFSAPSHARPPNHRSYRKLRKRRAHAQPIVAQNGRATPVQPKPVDEAALKSTLETRMAMKVDGLVKGPVGNLYEVRVGDDVFYADPAGNYIVIGNVIDVRTRENLTRARIDAIKQASLPPFKFVDLPLDDAVAIVKGSGKRKVAIFEDPNCGYCKKLEKSILDIGDVTVYVFLYPVLGPDSLTKSKQVWCSADRARAWTGWMQDATALAGDGACKTPLDKTLALGKQLRIDGTPTLFFSNNKRVEGAIDAATLEKLLAG